MGFKAGSSDHPASGRSTRTGLEISMDECKSYLSLSGNSPIVWPTIIVAVAGLYSYLT
jgi:hypothetical protein